MEPGILLSIALALLAFGLVSRQAERSILTPPMWFVLVGLSVHTFGVLEVSVDDAAIHVLAELALVLVLFTDAARIDLTCLRREESLPLRLLGVGLPVTIAAGGAVAFVLFPGFGIIEVVLLAAILAPTDAALGQAVVSNSRVPVRIRQSLNVESGLNDGLALPVVLILGSLAGATTEGGDLWFWARFALLQVVLGPLAGIVTGYVGGRLVDAAVRRRWVNAPFERLSVLGLALCAFAGAELIGGNGFIAAFAAGLTLGQTARGTCSHLYEFGEAEGQLLTLLVFLIVGSVMIPAAAPLWTLPVIAYALLSLTAIRMVPVAISLVGTRLRMSSVAFIGWFGPRGLASILFVLLIIDGNRLAVAPQLQAIVVLTVFLSTMLHGVTAYPLMVRYASLVEKMGDASMPEHRYGPDLPVRIRHQSDHA